MSDSEKPKSSWRERRQSIKHKWQVPFVHYVEWPCEWISYWLKEWAFLDILGHAGRLAILVALISYIMGAESRQKAKHYQAWQVISAAQGKPGGGGRKDALEDLHKDGISLAGVDISMAYLPKLNLEYTDLGDANLAGAYLWGANLDGANLWFANLAGAKLWHANLTGANIKAANLAGANLLDANLAGADLKGANLTGADLKGANFSGANLVDANLAGTDLFAANLTGADLVNADLTNADLGAANLAGAKLGDANLDGAKLVGANLAGADLGDANLDGAKLGGANLDGAKLGGANLAGADPKNIKNWQDIESVAYANIYNIQNPPDEFIKWALEKGAVSIEDEEEWKKLIREKMQERTKDK